MENCLFCKIARKEIPSKIIAESPLAIAFKDVDPKAPLHVLIVSKEHVDSFMDLQHVHADTVIEMLNLAQEVTNSQGAHDSGVRLVTNYGRDAGQSVKHLHMHVLGKRKLAWPPG